MHTCSKLKTQYGEQALLLLALLAAIALLPACPRPGSAVRPSLEMEALHIKVGPDELGLESYDAQTLMEKGAEVFNAGRHQLAAKYFQRLLDQYPESPRVPAALFNLGLCAEMQGDFAKARTLYERIIREFPKGKEVLDASFRLGAAFIGLRLYDDGLRVFKAIGEAPGLTDYDRLEASVNVGVCLTGLNRLDEAETELFSAMTAYRKISQKEYIENNYFMAEGQFQLGEINRLRMEQVKLEFPQEQIERSLEYKAQLLLDAQAQYIKAIRIGNIHWAAASGFKVGNLYETFHKHLVGAPSPPDLTEEQAQVYHEELHKKVSVLLAKAIAVYEKNLDMAQRVGLSSKWVEETSGRLDKLKDLYLRESAQ